MELTSSCAVIPPQLLKIPPFPAVAAKLLTLLSNPAVEIGEIAEVVSSDAVLTARLLQSVNSYKYGLKSYVTDICQAVGLAGLDQTRQITITSATATYVKRLMTAELLRCWHHSIATAVLAEEIAQSFRAYANVAFVAGIMHDVGRLGLMIAYPLEYQLLLQDAAGNFLDVLDLLELEEHKFGINHAEAGRILTESWGLPEEFHVVSGRHHDSCDGTELHLLWIVHVACRLADALGFGVMPPKVQLDPSAVLNELPKSLGAGLKKTVEELCALIEERISTAT